MATIARLLENSLLIIWNDRNPVTRLESMEKTYTSDVRFFENNNSEAFTGHQAINDLISRLHKEWPEGSQFELNKPSQVNHNVQIASWNLGLQGASPFATGTDVAMIENDLIKSFHLFLDPI